MPLSFDDGIEVIDQAEKVFVYVSVVNGFPAIVEITKEQDRELLHNAGDDWSNYCVSPDEDGKTVTIG